MLRLGCLFLSLPFAAFATVSISPLFQDGVVLQREKPVPVWGTGTPGEKMRVQFRAQNIETVVANDGRWKTELAAERASDEPAELVVVASNTLRVRDVLVGDVWLCGGQSNMEFTVASATNASQEIAAATDPLIRHFKVKKISATEPQAEVAGTWQSATPATVGEFTAVGYFFAREWRQRTGVPVGLIDATWGGTQIESWMSREALAKDPAFPAVSARWKKLQAEFPVQMKRYQLNLEKWREEKAAAAKAGQPFTRRAPGSPASVLTRRTPSILYNAMVHPLQPCALRGILWYQGEANADNSGEYRTLFQTLIQQWRADFQQGELPFGFVQLANLERAIDKTGEQWAQAEALQLPATGMVVTIDVGDPQDIHPKNKQDVGRRLAWWARAALLGESVPFTGPRFSGAKIDGATMRLSFSEARGLRAAGGELGGFELAARDGKFLPATAVIDGETVVVTSAGLADPVAVRYAWRNAPIASLFNAAGLPAAPFRYEQP